LIIEFDENWADKGDRLELRSIYISKISIPNASEQTIETLVQKCLEAKGQNCQQWEKEIDQIVYQLYDLTPAEIALIENP